MAEAASEDDIILEGFLCPICKADLKNPVQLTTHFESLHKEEQDVLKSLKGMFGKAKKKILNFEESDFKDSLDRALGARSDYTYVFEPQEIGAVRNVSNYFKAVRSSKLERYAAETNKLLIRLDKLVTNMPNEWSLRRQHEQDIVPWLDGSLVKLCPGCAKSFNITRRQHHCRLCGSILCHDCSCFLDVNIAKCMTDPSQPPPRLQPTADQLEKSGLRLCEHCYKLIELRKQMQDSRNAKTVLVTAYEQMRSLMEQASPAVAMYDKMCTSLYDGETTYNVGDVNALRGRIGKLAEGIDLLSKQMAALPTDQPGDRQNKLQNAIRLASAHYIKEQLLSLRTLPTEAQISEVRCERREQAQQRIEAERRRAQMDRVMNTMPNAGSVISPDGAPGKSNDDQNPLLEQINIIRGYIKEARQDMRFEEVAILERNLKELKQEYYLQTSGISS